MAKNQPKAFLGSYTDVFLEMPCLKERSSKLDGQALRRTWFKAFDKRNVAQALQKFISYNNEWFNFLGVEANLDGFDQSASLSFRSTNMVGTIPLRAPDTGKQIGDFVVTPRFTGKDRFGGYIELLDLLDEEISPEFKPSIPLASARIFRPPMYLEAAKFIGSLEELLKRPWRKFKTREILQNVPSGRVNWTKHAIQSYKVESQLSFPASRSVLDEYHDEFREIRFVFDICNRELTALSTPRKTRELFKNRLSFLEERLYFHLPKPVTQLKLRSADSPTVKLCKGYGNKILNQKFIDGTAWRVDFNDVFEKLVQHIFTQVARSIGGQLHKNPRIAARTTRRYAWELNSLEPDAVLQKDNLTIPIDAKYKSHLFNRFEQSEILKSDFRADLHQILAYSTFNDARDKTCILCYPSDRVEAKSTRFNTGIGNGVIRVLVTGVPVDRSAVDGSIAYLSEVVSPLLTAKEE